jgi:hypothetical protein
MRRRTVWVLLRTEMPEMTTVESVWSDSRAARAAAPQSKAHWERGSLAWFGWLGGRVAWVLVPKPLREARG